VALAVCSAAARLRALARRLLHQLRLLALVLPLAFQSQVPLVRHYNLLVQPQPQRLPLVFR
jgi:hypothetical protein